VANLANKAAGIQEITRPPENPGVFKEITCKSPDLKGTCVFLGLWCSGEPQEKKNTPKF
jgi:hypothetical protein